MKSVQLVAERKLEVLETMQPRDPGPGEIVVRLRAVGICGSDMHWYAEGGIGSTKAVYPQILGHEPAGEIVSLGPGVSGLRVGQRVALEPAITCGHCELCRSGRHNNCLTSRFMGTPQLPGFLREFATLPAHNAVPLPEGLSFVEATVIEPLSVILHIMELTPVELGNTVAIMGAGPIGLLTAAVARICGASKVFVADKVPERLAIAREMGADCAVNMREASIVDAVFDQTGGRGVDIVFDAAAALETVNAAIAVARPGGTVVLVGIPSEKTLAMDIHQAMNKELNLQTIKRSNHNAHTALELLQAGKITDRIVTHRFPIDRTPEAFSTLHAYANGVCKAVIELP